jgi:hypothetical protein
LNIHAFLCIKEATQHSVGDGLIFDEQAPSSMHKQG